MPQKKIFFNHSTVSSMRKPVYKAASLFLKEYYEVGPPEVLLTYEPYVDKLAEEAAKLIHCSKDEITYIKNTTEGIFLASEALPLSQGDEVVVWGNGYPVTFLPWLKKKQDGILVKIVPGEDNSTMTDALINALGPKTKVLMVAWIQHLDGFVCDLRRLSEACRARGVYLVVDGVQGVGIREINVSELGVDFLVCGGQKYLGAGVGLGFMYVRKEIIPTLKHIKIGMRSMERFDTESYTIRNTARRFEDGTLNLFGIVALHAALLHVHEVGIETIEQRSKIFLTEAKALLREHAVPFIEYPEQGNVIAVRTEDPVALHDFLRARSIYTKAFKGILRISFLYDSKIEEFEELVTAMVEWKI